jgi:hypothetical protein
MRKGVLLLLVLVLIGSCAPQPHRRGVRPDPPGPIDAIRMLSGDYSSLCPKDYDYCAARGHAVCCPFEQGCCEDGGGPYCCSGRGDRDWPERDYGRPRESFRGCSSSEITCSHADRTICCSSEDGCCAGADGPYCCAAAQEPSRDDGY